ncbi:MAG: hypothetical protein WBK08_18095 [Nitrospira sp.]
MFEIEHRRALFPVDADGRISPDFETTVMGPVAHSLVVLYLLPLA